MGVLVRHKTILTRVIAQGAILGSFLAGVFALFLRREPFGRYALWQSLRAAGGVGPFLAALWPWLLIGAALLALAVYYFKIYRMHLDMANESVVADGNEFDVSAIIRGADEGSWSSVSLRSFVDAIVDPARTFRRISEVHEPYTRSVKNTTVLTVATREGVSPFIVPVAVVSRTADPMSLRVQDHSGRRLATMPREETLSLVLAAIRQLIRAVGPDALARFVTPRPDGSASHEQWLAALLAGGPQSVGLDARQLQVASAQLRAHMNEVIGVSGGEDSPITPATSRLTQFAGSFVGTLPICVDIADLVGTGPQKKITRLTVEQRLVPVWARPHRLASPAREALASAAHRGVPWSKRWRLVTEIVGELRNMPRIEVTLTLEIVFSRIRQFVNSVLGIRSNYISHELANAARTANYHLDVRGPEGTYVGRQWLDTRGPRNWRDSLVSRTHGKASPARGQRHAHLIVRGGNRSRVNRLNYNVAFFERPPGSMMGAFVVALATLVIVGILAKNALDAEFRAADIASLLPGTHSTFNERLAYLDYVASKPSPGQPTSLLSVLLAFPVSFAASMNLTQRSPFDGVAAARFANGASIFVALAAFSKIAAPGLWISSMSGVIWGTLVAMSGFLAVVTLGSALMRVAVYNALVSPGWRSST